MGPGVVDIAIKRRLCRAVRQVLGTTRENNDLFFDGMIAHLAARNPAGVIKEEEEEDANRACHRIEKY